jgi:predicted 2-oxoglutarate/Fe(II)-dependent dioxygenase YbiX
MRVDAVSEEPIESSAVPLLIVDGVLDADLVDELLAVADEVGWFRSPMIRPGPNGEATLVADTAIKARHDHRLADEALMARVGNALVERLLPAVAMSFAFAARSHEAFKIVRYDSGDGWFAAHRDNVTPDAAHRRFAVTINLDADYTGGCLRFPELTRALYKPRPGSAIVFSCGLLHEVTPVTAGTRNALITFLW